MEKTADNFEPLDPTVCTSFCSRIGFIHSQVAPAPVTMESFNAKEKKAFEEFKAALKGELREYASFCILLPFSFLEWIMIWI
jgi:hypothetical protein